MPEPLTWNKPGLLWSSGATWNGVAGKSPKTMSNTKAIVDFSGYTAAELGPIAQNIHLKMTANAATFDEPTTTMTALQTLITTSSMDSRN